MEGFTNDEIAAQLGRSRRTVTLKLEAIRALWSQEPTP
jgi:DNA-binding NarL/FixJ family response regulator